MKLAHQNILIFSTLLFIMMLGYQNCGPVPEGYGPSDPGDDVGISDPLPEHKVGFLSAEIFSNLQEDIYGACPADQDGATLRWWAEDLDGEVVKVGSAHCWEGEFVLHLEELSELSCHEDYSLHVQLGARAHAQANLLVDCL